MTDEQRRAIATAVEALRPHFPGENMRLYVPRSDAKARAEQRRRIVRALKNGDPAALIAKREDVSERYVRKLRGAFGTLPP